MPRLRKHWEQSLKKSHSQSCADISMIQNAQFEKHVKLPLLKSNGMRHPKANLSGLGETPKRQKPKKMEPSGTQELLLLSCSYPRISWVYHRQFTSIDPAPPSSQKFASSGLLRGTTSNQQTSSVSALRAQLLDTSIPLFQRYRAMFALRNIGTPAAIDALADGFSDDSALFKYAKTD